MEKELTYYDGIIEGRLIENDFVSIGDSMFVCRTAEHIYAVTVFSDHKIKLEIYNQLPSLSGSMDSDEFIWNLRDEAFNVLEVTGRIDDILEVVRMYKAWKGGPS